MRLYFVPGAGSLSPHIVLRESGQDFELEQVDLQTKTTKRGADFTRVNPKGQIPALQLDDGTVLTEGPAIVQYIAERKPEAGLMPPVGHFDRYRVLEWLNFISSELHTKFNALFRPDTPPEGRSFARAKLLERIAFVDQQLAGRDFLVANRFTVAEAYCFAALSWTKYQGIDLAVWPNAQAYLSRIAARPAVQAAMRAEGLVSS